MFVKIKADIRHWLRELDKKYFCVMLGFAVMVYFPLISLKLTNTVDGLWTTAEYMAGAWELSNGRWFWLVTSFLRFSLQLEPINAVVCLVLVSLGVTRLHMLFKPAWMRTSCIDWLAGLCYVSNVVVGCYLSFHFIAPEYGFSFFFAMLATEHVIRGKSAVSSIVPAAVLLALSLGLYQTNLACFCLVLLAYFLLLLFQNGEKQKIREYICKSLASAASGAVLYLLILKITLWATGTAMADYQGGADISVSGILKNLPSSVEKCYELFYRYFFGTLVKHNMLQETAVVFALIFCVVGAALACRLVRLIRRKDWENTFYGTAALLVLPLTADTAAAAALRSWLGRRQLEGGCLLTPPVNTGEELPARLVEIAAARADRLRRKGTAWAVVECTETAAALLPLYFRQGFGLRALRPLESLAPCFLLRTGCVPARTAPVWVPLEDRVQLALLLAKGYAALDSRPYGGSLALALYPLKETE